MREAIAIAALIPSILDRLAVTLEQRRYGERDDQKPPGAHLLALFGGTAAEELADRDCDDNDCQDDDHRQHLPAPVIAVGAVANDAAEGVTSKGYQGDCGRDEDGGHASLLSGAVNENLTGTIIPVGPCSSLLRYATLSAGACKAVSEGGSVCVASSLLEKCRKLSLKTGLPTLSRATLSGACQSARFEPQLLPVTVRWTIGPRGAEGSSRSRSGDSVTPRSFPEGSQVHRSQPGRRGRRVPAGSELS